MKSLSTALAAASFLILTACGETLSREINVASPSGEGLNGAAALPADKAAANPEILSMAYRSATHDIAMDLRYTGCGGTIHELLLSVCQESYPQQCQAQLLRPKAYDASCGKVVTETLIAPLDASLDMAYIILKNSDGINKSVLVDKTGKGAPIPPGDGEGGAAPVVSEATIKSLSYDKTVHSLKLDLEYTACEAVQHGLDFSPICTASYPSGCSAKLVRVAYSKAACATVQHESMVYKLTEAQDAMVLTVINSAGKGPNVLIDHYGKVAAATKP